MICMRGIKKMIILSLNKDLDEVKKRHFYDVHLRIIYNWLRILEL